VVAQTAPYLSVHGAVLPWLKWDFANDTVEIERKRDPSAVKHKLLQLEVGDMIAIWIVSVDPGG
jgi:hypothetical protein